MHDEMKRGTLYMSDGSKFTDVTEVTDNDLVDNREKKTSLIDFSPEPISITANFHMTPRWMIAFLTGKFPSNNWLKMHGGVMERKTGKRKGKHSRNGGRK